jgi:hypothetical protein
MARNDFIFKGHQPDVRQCKRNFFKELKMVLHRVKTSALTSFESWLQNILAT